MSAFNDYYVNVFKNKYADFSGRARRSEYWYFALFNALLGMVLGFVAGLLGGIMGNETVTLIIIGVFYLGIIIPSIAIGVRRLHDTGKSGWLYLLALIPILGGLILLVFFCTDSQAGTNKWGANPKGHNAIADHLI